MSDGWLTEPQAARQLGLPPHLVRARAFADEAAAADQDAPQLQGPPLRWRIDRRFRAMLYSARCVSALRAFLSERRQDPALRAAIAAAVDDLRDDHGTQLAIGPEGDEVLAARGAAAFRSIARTAQILGVNERAVLRMLDRRELAGRKRPRPGLEQREWRVRPDSIERALERQVF